MGAFGFVLGGARALRLTTGVFLEGFGTGGGAGAVWGLVLRFRGILLDMEDIREITLVLPALRSSSILVKASCCLWTVAKKFSILSAAAMFLAEGSVLRFSLRSSCMDLTFRISIDVGRRGLREKCSRSSSASEDDE